MTFKRIHALLQAERDDDALVAVHGEKRVFWLEFRDLIQDRRRHSRTDRRRVLIADSDAVEFLAHLLAVLADDDVAVIPPNFQPETLATFTQLAPPEYLEPHVVEMYTSGSTGEPKCIRKHLAELEAECEVQESAWGEALGDATIIATTPHHHIYGLLFRLLWPLCAGRPFDSATISEPSALVERLGAFEKAVLISSPAQLSRIPELLDLANMRKRPALVFSSGGPLSLATAIHYQQSWGDAPVEVFGSTESGGVAWRRQTVDPRWMPLPEVQVSSDVDGALLVRSPFLPCSETLRMEDAVSIDADGRFTLLGRLDRIVKIEEKRLSLPEMERWLASHPAVHDCAIASLRIGERVVVGAAVIAREATAERRKELIALLRDHLRQRFDNVLLPRRWRFVERLPYTDRGKLSPEHLESLLNAPL